MSLNLEEIHQLALSARDAGREVLLSYFGRLSNVEEKFQAGLVSEADVESEKRITEILKAGLPGVEVLGEESHFQSEGPAVDPTGNRWILDPLDGTTNYVHGFHIFTISLALQWEGRLVYGMVDAPLLDTTYHGAEGKGAFKNAKPMQVSQRETLSEALVATGFACSRPEILKQQLGIFSRVLPKIRAVRRAGSAAYDLCMVAEGIYDAYWERGLQAWDCAAGALIVKEAGGNVSDYQGRVFSVYQDSIIAANPRVYPRLLSEVQG